MKQLTVISGKGGTGKTILTASFAVLAKKKVMADCDVDAADLHLLLHPDIRETHKFEEGKKAAIDPELCTECGRCREVCRFDAISEDYVVDPIGCEGCRVCHYLCPENAIGMEKNLCGEWYLSDTKYGPLVHAKLGIAEENSGKLVTLVKQKAKELASIQSLDLVIIDGPPGIGCPVISSLAGVDLALAVTEPTISGVHDLERVVAVAHHFGVKTAAVINKYDINPEVSAKIEDWCENREVPVLGKIPFDRIVVEALVAGVPLMEYSQNGISQKIEAIWRKLLSL
jgi:MinD superfamily P-loop ATPase